MTHEQREEIEKIIEDVEGEITVGGWVEMPVNKLVPLLQFARQQLNLRVDGEKLLRMLRELDKEDSMEVGVEKALEALVLECLTTTPEEKE